jgi:hypothetical protein
MPVERKNNDKAAELEHCAWAHVPSLTLEARIRPALPRQGLFPWMKTAYPAQPEMSAARLKKELAASVATSERKFKESSIRRQGLPSTWYGQTADAVRESAAGVEKRLRTTIKTQPYTATLVAFGIGWLPGRMHRPV